MISRTTYKKGQKIFEGDFKPKLKLDLDGPDGNAFVIMALCRRAAWDDGWSAKRIEDFLNECKSSTYAHLLDTVRKNFDVSEI